MINESTNKKLACNCCFGKEYPSINGKTVIGCTEDNIWCNDYIAEKCEEYREKGTQPVNVYGTTDYYENGMLECTFDGFGYRDNDGNITWYQGYNPPKDDDFYYTLIVPYGNGCDLSELIK